MAKPVIAIDVDDVLAPFTPRFISFYNERFGTHFQISDMLTYHFEDMTGVDKDLLIELFEEFITTPEFTEDMPIAGAIEAIEKLKEKYQIDIITARHGFSRDQTAIWLRRHFQETFRGVHFIRDANTNKAITTKAQICQQVGATVLIDDHPDYIIEAAEVGIKAILFGGYNWHDIELPDGAIKAKNWDEVLQELM